MVSALISMGFRSSPKLVAVGAIVVLALLGGSFFWTYNNLVSLDQGVKSAWAQVQTQYQRRIDLIPNLVNTVKGYFQFESGLLTNVTALRSQWLNSPTLNDQVQAGSALDSALNRLLVVYENYPQLQAITAVSGLMDELAGTENRIAVERMRFNLAVQDYNTAIHSIPSNLVAGSLGFTEKSYYQSALGADNVPTVSFGP